MIIRFDDPAVGSGELTHRNASVVDGDGGGGHAIIISCLQDENKALGESF
jgi:hypothetical protein